MDDDLVGDARPGPGEHRRARDVDERRGRNAPQPRPGAVGKLAAQETAAKNEAIERNTNTRMTTPRAWRIVAIQPTILPAVASTPPRWASLAFMIASGPRMIPSTNRPMIPSTSDVWLACWASGLA